MKKYTMYTRKVGAKTWKKYFSFPKTLEELEPHRTYCISHGVEVKIVEASHGKLYNY